MVKGSRFTDVRIFKSAFPLPGPEYSWCPPEQPPGEHSKQQGLCVRESLLSNMGLEKMISSSTVHRDRRRRPHVVISMVVNEVFKLLGLVLDLVQNDVVMNWTRRPLQRNMRVQKEVPIVRAGDVSADQSSWQSVAVPIGRVPVAKVWECPDMVTLVGDHHGEFAVPLLAAGFHDDGFDVWHFALQDMSELTRKTRRL